MPELPEVETVALGLRDFLLGKEITLAKIILHKLIASNPSDFSKQLKGKRFVDVRRHGKNLFIEFSGKLTLWSHLRMTGRFIQGSKQTPLDKHDHFYFDLKNSNDNSQSRLIYRDVRKFGFVKLLSQEELNQNASLRKLGPDALEIGKTNFVNLFSGKSRMIKPALMDQSFIAGLGNIYVDEALFQARIHPRESTVALELQQIVELRKVIRALLRKALKNMGTTFDSFARTNGKPGRFQSYLKVYGRTDQPCRDCGSRIKRDIIGQRSTHFCPNCQTKR